MTPAHDCPFSAVIIQISEDIGNINGTLDGISQKQEQIYKSIEGNGQPGLRQRVEALERSQSAEHEIKSTKRSSVTQWASWLAVVASWIAAGVAILKVWK
jgi:hypothetical protein